MKSKNDPKSVDLAAIESELRTKPTSELRKLFHESHGQATRLIARAAVCVKIMHERGVDLSGIPMKGTFLRVASGQILPELIWEFAESPNRVVVERLPVDQQKKIVSDPMVTIVEPKPDGGFDKRRVDLRTAPRTLAKLAIGDDGIRSVEEQMSILGAAKTYAAVKNKSEDTADSTPKEPYAKTVTIKLTASEYEALKINAALAHCKEHEIARRGLLKSGYLEKPKVSKRTAV